MISGKSYRRAGKGAWDPSLRAAETSFLTKLGIRAQGVTEMGEPQAAVLRNKSGPMSPKQI